MICDCALGFKSSTGHNWFFRWSWNTKKETADVCVCVSWQQYFVPQDIFTLIETVYYLTCVDFIYHVKS